jgi:DNA-binding NarL/FixJ family response regulator
VSAPLRVLIVDDNDDIRRLVGMQVGLEEDMEIVGEARDGAAGLEAAECYRPDVVVLDLSMPVMDGLEALPLLRALLPDARIVMLSGFDRYQFADTALDLGADAYVEKGGALADLVALVREPRRARAVPPARKAG